MNKFTKPVFLCGMMGSGKSTIGKLLADELETPFTDLDDLIAEEAGMSIPEIFEARGENGFRQLERNVLAGCIQTVDGVVALGGGALQNQAVTDHIKLMGWLIFLDAPADVLYHRLAGTGGRPMIESQDQTTLRDKINHLLDTRRPLYSQAQITIQTENKEPKEIVRIIIKRLKMNDA